MVNKSSSSGVHICWVSDFVFIESLISLFTEGKGTGGGLGIHALPLKIDEHAQMQFLKMQQVLPSITILDEKYLLKPLIPH